MPLPQLPVDLLTIVQDLELRASTYLQHQRFRLAEEVYRSELELMIRRQEKQKARIHKGAPLHMLGITLLLQGKHDDALKQFVLAYIEDILTYPPSEVDKTPAALTLRSGYKMGDYALQLIKEVALENPLNILDPETILHKFLKKAKIEEVHLVTLCGESPDPNKVAQQLFGRPILSETSDALDVAVERLRTDILRRAGEIATKKGRQQILAEDIREALQQLGEKASE